MAEIKLVEDGRRTEFRIQKFLGHFDQHGWLANLFADTVPERQLVVEPSVEQNTVVMSYRVIGTDGLVFEFQLQFQLISEYPALELQIQVKITKHLKWFKWGEFAVLVTDGLKNACQEIEAKLDPRLNLKVVVKYIGQKGVLSRQQAQSSSHSCQGSHDFRSYEYPKSSFQQGARVPPTTINSCPPEINFNRLADVAFAQLGYLIPPSYKRSYRVAYYEFIKTEILPHKLFTQKNKDDLKEVIPPEKALSSFNDFDKIQLHKLMPKFFTEKHDMYINSVVFIAGQSLYNHMLKQDPMFGTRFEDGQRQLPEPNKVEYEPVLTFAAVYYPLEKQKWSQLQLTTQLRQILIKYKLYEPADPDIRPDPEQELCVKEQDHIAKRLQKMLFMLGVVVVAKVFC